MSDPIVFESQTPRFGLPLLFAGQAQKEAFVNEALSRADALVHCAVDGEAATPPASPAEGDCWLVAPSPTGAWLGQAGRIACRQAGQWLFQSPRDGMRLLDRSTGQERRFVAGWKVPVAPAEPSGGSTVDAQARAVIHDIVVALRTAGIFPAA
jgi:Protein of unknown function (DUF2793)